MISILNISGIGNSVIEWNSFSIYSLFFVINHLSFHLWKKVKKKSQGKEGILVQFYFYIKNL